MSNQPQLSTGAIYKMINGNLNPNDHPILQLLDFKLLQAKSNNPEGQKSDRFRLLLSDGQHLTAVMMSTQLNSQFKDGNFTTHCILQVKEWTCNEISNKKILILIEVIKVRDYDAMIGTPVQIDASSSIQDSSNSSNQNQNQSNPNRFNPQQAQQHNQQFNLQQNHHQQQNYQQQNQQHQFNQNSNQNHNQADLNIHSFHGQPVIPIGDLTPYMKSWVIRGRVTAKSDLRSWKKEASSNTQGGGSSQGQFFHLDLVDSTGEIRVTCWNEAADTFFSVFETNKVYFISRGQVKFSNSRFRTLKNDYEISLDKNATVQMDTSGDSDSSVPKLKYDPVKIAEIQQIPAQTMIDVIGVVSKVGSIETIKLKAQPGQTQTKRNITLVDDTFTSIEVTFWGPLADKFNESLSHQILAIRGARVTDFGGKSLGTTKSSVIDTNPDLPHSHALRDWVASLRSDVTINPLSAIKQSGGDGSSGKKEIATDDRITLAQAKEDKSFDNGSIYFNTRAFVSGFKKDPKPWYQSCPECKKKVTEITVKRVWQCDKCKIEMDKPQPRYILSLAIYDQTSSIWINAFHQEAMTLLGVDVPELDSMDDKGYSEVFNNASLRSYVFRIQAREERYNDENRTKFQVQVVEPTNFVKESKLLLKQIEQLSF